jgi:hypothetical protein
MAVMSLCRLLTPGPIVTALIATLITTCLVAGTPVAADAGADAHRVNGAGASTGVGRCGQTENRTFTVVIGIGERIEIDSLDGFAQARLDRARNHRLAVNTQCLGASQAAPGKQKCHAGRNMK